MKKLVIIPGGFHPFHAGHMHLYNSAREAFPDADVYVAATDDTSERPFPFALKNELATLAGVKAGHFVKVKSPFGADEITNKYDPDTTQLIYIKSKKNSITGPSPEGPFPTLPDPKTGKLPLVTRGARKGLPVSDRLQYYKKGQPMAPMSRHTYLAYLPTVKFGPGMTSASEIRAEWPKLDVDGKKARVISLYPNLKSNPALVKKVVAKLDTAIGGGYPVPPAKNLKENLVRLIQQVRPLLKEANAEQKIKLLKLIKEAHSEQDVAESKSLTQIVKIVKGPDAGKTGWIREIKHGAFKGAPKTYYVDLDDGGQANNLPGTALRLVKDNGVAESSEQINEYRDRMYQYIKSIVPTWPDYVVKDWLYANFARGNVQTANYSFDTLGKDLPKILADAGLSTNTSWQLVPDMKFTMDMWEPKTLKRLQARAGGSSKSTDPDVHIPAKDAERHATQAALAQQQGGVRKEPVIIIKTTQGYELLEGWHRTIQHFAKYPDGYTGPAYVAVAQSQQGMAEAAYPGNIGIMELAKFFDIATLEEKTRFKQLMNIDEKNKAWKLIQQVTGVKLQGKEFAEQRARPAVAEDQVYEADASAVQFQTASTNNYQSSFTVTAIADGKNVGHFSFFRDPETDDVHNQAEVTDDVRGKGYGKALLLKAIEVANDHGLGFQEDSQSLSRAQSRVYDSLNDAGWIVDADGYWFLTPEGEQELARLSTIQQGMVEGSENIEISDDKSIVTISVDGKDRFMLRPAEGHKPKSYGGRAYKYWTIYDTERKKDRINPNIGMMSKNQAIAYVRKLVRLENKSQQAVKEGSEKITWIKPNFDYEWDEIEFQAKQPQVPADVRNYMAKHFPNKPAWMKSVQHGRPVVVRPDHGQKIRNYPDNKRDLLQALSPASHDPEGPAKEKRVNDLFDKGGPIEMPIILRTEKGLWLIGGKTRLGTANLLKGIPAKVWMIGGEQGLAEGSLADAAKHVKKGALHKQEHIPLDKKIGATKLKSLKAHGTPLERKRANFALNIQGIKENAVTDLERDMKPHSNYEAINDLMTDLAANHNITPEELHDKFVNKHGMIPDEWIKHKPMSEADEVPDYDRSDELVRRLKDKAAASKELARQGKKPETRLNPKTGKYRVDFTAGPDYLDEDPFRG